MNILKKSFNQFMILWFGEFISAIGSGLTAFGFGVYVYQQTGKASHVALVTLCAFLPGFLLTPVAGVFADRYDRRLLMVLGDSLSALGLIFILICMLQGKANTFQICLGVGISSIFSFLLEPCYKATVTDLLSEEEYTRASGMIQLAGAAKYLISPVMAGFLLSVSDIKLLIWLDICTFFITAASTLAVRKGIVSKSGPKDVELKQNRKDNQSFAQDITEGWFAITENKGVFILVLVSSVITFFLGFIQTLSTPMILAFSDSNTLAMIQTISALGMLISSMVISMGLIKKNYLKKLVFSLFGAGIFMAGFGLRENRILICASGFLFFAMLAVANTNIDFLARTHIKNECQGRAWGLIGIISQLGYILSYIFSGLLADYIFTPLLLDGGKLSKTIGRIIGTGSGRGAGLLIVISGILLSAVSVVLYPIKAVQKLEVRGDICTGQ